LKAYLLASDKPEVEPWRFEEWNRLIRGAILWLGLPDPLGGLREAEAQDPEREALGAVLQAWRERFEDRPTPAREAIEPLQELWGVAISSRSGVNVKTVGRLLARQAERRVDGLRFVRAGKDHQAVLWMVAKDGDGNLLG
jgi:putative DNA primase/helicase